MVGLAIWFVVGWVTVLIQNQWGYQFMLPLVPLGLFAVVGVDRLRSAWACTDGHRGAVGIGGAHHRRGARRAVPGTRGVHKTKQLVSDDFTLNAAGRHHFEAEFEPYYPKARAAAAFLREPGRTPGAIHVEGNPLIQYLSGRPYALREHGWAPEQSDAQIVEVDPRRHTPTRAPSTCGSTSSHSKSRAGDRPRRSQLIDSLYCRVRHIADGTWYALRTSHECIGAR